MDNPPFFNQFQPIKSPLQNSRIRYGQNETYSNTKANFFANQPTTSGLLTKNSNYAILPRVNHSKLLTNQSKRVHSQEK